MKVFALLFLAAFAYGQEECDSLYCWKCLNKVDLAECFEEGMGWEECDGNTAKTCRFTEHINTNGGVSQISNQCSTVIACDNLVRNHDAHCNSRDGTHDDNIICHTCGCDNLPQDLCTCCDSSLTEWVDEGACSLTCGGGVQRQVRSCVNDDNEVCGAPFCNGASEERFLDCNTQECPIPDCTCESYLNP